MKSKNYIILSKIDRIKLSDKMLMQIHMNKHKNVQSKYIRKTKKS